MCSALQQLPDKHKQILLIDSHQENQSRLKSILEQHPLYQLTRCNDHVEALLILQQSSIDFILLSCNNSPLPCSTIIADLHKFRPNTPIIALSPHITEEQGQKLLTANATDFLSYETLNTEILLRTLRHAELTIKQSTEIQLLRHSDTLAPVGNRQFFYLTLLYKLNSLIQQGRQLALITVDLDHFRKFNTRYGFSAGDEVVLELGKRIQSSVSNDAMVARIGNDEFAIILDLPGTAPLLDTVKSLLGKLINTLKSSYTHSQSQTQIDCSIGAVLAPEHGSEVDLLTKRASMARMQAKQIHGCSYSIYRPGMELTSDKTVGLESEIMTALRAEQFVLFYQPRVDLHSGKIVGAEALIRWQHPTRGMIMPSDFIPLCEQNGLIVPIGYWTIRQAGLHLKELKEAGIHIDRLGVNLSFRQFKDDMLVDTIKRIIKQEDIDTSVLEFELTESAIFNDENHVRECLDSLAEEGITFSLDDFGTGYSSFSLLHKLPINALKIDRSFVSHLNESSEAEEIVRSIISLAHNMKLTVVAEGVETREQLDFLIQDNCDQIQGYFYSPPVSFSDFKRMLPKPE
ncbi:two-component system response regulator [Neptuniibacter marinus]|uniref:two-component system response regulator n=1 Tax=Neptuniibacter marinus TaxID=1806670 RepID=UPI000834BB01|nr:GGDEF domain-containing response regulator [Neptuniibacter marinus]